jgi:polysaccharide biosynthesis/export protein
VPAVAHDLHYLIQKEENCMKKIKILFANELFLSFISIILFILLLLNSCANNKLNTATMMQLNASPEKSQILNSALAEKKPELQRIAAVSDYRIGPEDLLEIDTFQVQDLKSTVRVSAQGFIKIPLLQRVKATGLTVAELETHIAKQLEKFVKEPVVSVFVKEYRSQQISVIGSVKEPRVHYATGQKYLLDILSLAGGLNDSAGSICIIQRPLKTDEGETIEKIVIDLDELLINGRADLNIPVLAGDVIQVPRSGIFFVDGAVKSPGEFHLKSKTTLTQAISMAKGMEYAAVHSDVKIYRENGTREREIISIDYDSILDGVNPDMPLKDKDIVIVASSGLKRFISTLSGSIGSGMFRIGGKAF